MYAMTVMDDRSFRWREVPDPVAGNGELLVEIHAAALNRAFIAAVHAPICLAGSVNSFARLDEIKAAGAAYFTIGSAFFAHAFGGDIADQINTVCDYMEAPHA